VGRRNLKMKTARTRCFVGCRRTLSVWFAALALTLIATKLGCAAADEHHKAPEPIFGTARRVARTTDGLLDNDVLESREYKPFYGTNDATDSVADAKGNIFITGSVIGRGAFPDERSSSSTRGGTDIFIARADPKTLEPTWFRQIGTEADDHASSIAVSGDGLAIFVAGWTRGFFQASAEQLKEKAGDRDCLLMRVTSTGVVLQVKQFGSMGRDYIEHVVYSEEDKSVVVVGHIEGDVRGEPRFFAGERLIGSQQNVTGFVAKFDMDLKLQWGRHVGLSARDTGTSVFRDSQGSVYISFATFNDKGSVFTLVEKIDPSGNIVWTSDTNALYISAGRSMAMYRGKLVISTTLFVNDVYKLGIIALNADTGKLVQSLSGCCDDGFAKASGGIVVTRGGHLYAIGHHSERRSGMGPKSPLVITIDPQGDVVSRKLTKVTTTESDARMTRPSIFNNTLYFATSRGASFWLHSFSLANVSDGVAVGEFGVGNNGSIIGGLDGEGINVYHDGGARNIWAIIGTILGAFLLAFLIVLGILLYRKYRTPPKPVNYGESTALTPYQTPYAPTGPGSVASEEPEFSPEQPIDIVEDDVRSNASDPVVYRFSPV